MAVSSWTALLQQSKQGVLTRRLSNSSEGELRQQGFEVVGQDETFIDRHMNLRGDDLWWLVIGRKP
jgi:hypothetical protein